MRKGLLLTLVLALVVAGLVFAAESKTIKGEVIDVSCYVAAGAKGQEHKSCALACLEAGEPAGILEERTGKVFIAVTSDHMTNPSKKMAPYAAKNVEVTGTVSERGGITTIDVQEIKEMKASAMGMSQEKGMPKENKNMMGY